MERSVNVHRKARSRLTPNVDRLKKSTSRLFRCAALVCGVLALSACSVARSAEPEFANAEKRREDFATFCRFVTDEYAYFDAKTTDWNRACAHFVVAAETATTRASYIDVLERTLQQLYDSHAHLGTNTPHSVRLVPSQTDVMATWKSGKALVIDVRRGSMASLAGIAPGDEILSINNVSVTLATAEFEPEFVRRSSNEAHEWSLRMALAGRHETPTVKLVIQRAGVARDVAYTPTFEKKETLLTSSLANGIGYVRINNSLGETGLVPAFDAALDGMSNVKALILDLRDTPSGGTSTVARGILSRLVDRERPYQRHELMSESKETGIRRIWVEFVAPRKPTFRAPIVVLVGSWTGSMGEGLAIGLNAARSTPVIGAPMAHLLGALGETRLPNTQITVRVPVEKLFHVNGTPRESFLPRALSTTPYNTAQDEELLAANRVAVAMSGNARARPSSKK